MKTEKYIAKLIIKDLDNLEEIELDRLIGWLSAKSAEVQEVYERKGKRIASSKDPRYDKTYTSRLIK